MTASRGKQQQPRDILKFFPSACPAHESCHGNSVIFAAALSISPKTFRFIPLRTCQITENGMENVSKVHESADNGEEEEDDYTGYFLEQTPNSASIIERVAEANRKLYEEGGPNEDETSNRPKKVQFSDSLVNIEPENYDSDEFVQSEENFTSEEDADRTDVASVGEEPAKSSPRPESANEQTKTENPEVKIEIPEEIPEKIAAEEASSAEDDPQQTKVLLVMLPREQSSSCESVIGEEIQDEKVDEPGDENKPAAEKDAESAPSKTEILKPAKGNRAHAPSLCKVSKITPDLNFISKVDSKNWEKKSARLRKPKKEEVKRESGRPKSSVERKREPEAETVPGRPKTATEKRSCCVARTGLPKYNGLRSEYGLSAEQLQERRRKTFELRQQKRTDRMKKRQEEIRKRIENEENFNRWLYSKRRGATVKRPAQVDTLSRSDVYIQNHAVYASRRGISYSVEYGLGRKKISKSGRIVVFDKKHEKSINLDRLFDNITPHVKRIYRIYLGGGGYL